MTPAERKWIMTDLEQARVNLRKLSDRVEEMEGIVTTLEKQVGGKPNGKGRRKPQKA